MINRVVINPKIMMGKPVVEGTRIPVYVIVNLTAEGYTAEQITKEYPDLTERDVQAALKFAARLADFEEVKVAA